MKRTWSLTKWAKFSLMVGPNGYGLLAESGSTYYECARLHQTRIRVCEALKTKKKISCPRCQETCSWDENPFRPFCSERCRTGDLGDWADEVYKIAETHELPSTSDLDPSLKKKED